MATTTANRARRWRNALSKYDALNQRLDEAQPHEVDAIERELADREAELFDLPSPSFEAVRQKLAIMWRLDIEKPDIEAGEKALILEDLDDLIAETAELLGSRA
ncbi:hypothetical protein KCP91_16305 [Microvirga sp. SRT01]|uniref:Uncharacterized protein n=1 Tax=Sphingomonas longa TaxID=2778730 RepID=A0ABS2DAM8_9SPHN|nr:MULTISPECIES: hypothetical protein [Alphaproteobacteria]MBM6577948.1 hypothetical protein [Sphingomonas sp. BT552]MBR7710989.1 hypothetical protein [Microvirga sp. SRT01]